MNLSKTRLVAVLTGGALTATLALFPATVRAAALAVNTTADTVDTAPGNGVCADASGACSLRAAIMEANASPGADTIILPAGTYTLTRPMVSDGLPEADPSAGDLDINDHLTLTGAGSATTIIQGGAGFNDKVISVNSRLLRAFYEGSDPGTIAAVTLSGVTIQNGHSSEPLMAGGDGGGLFFAALGGEGALSLDGVVIRNNVTDNGYGGGVALLNGTSWIDAQTVQFTNVTVADNIASAAAGGGIFAGGGMPVSMNGASITGNHTGGAAPAGGGIYLEDSGAVSTITGTVISGNVADNAGGNSADGGGLYVAARSVVVQNSTISGNTADRDGGGVYLIHAAARSSSFTNVTLSGNTAGQRGGGILANVANSAASVTLTNATITANRATSGDGGGLNRLNSAGAVTLQNTIVAGNRHGTGAGTPDDARGAITGTYNLFGTGGSGSLAGGAGNQYNVADARLAPLAVNGGGVPTHALRAGSLALDAGSSALNAEPTDARGAGFARLKDAADADTVAQIDLGAYEAFPTVADVADQQMLQGTTHSVAIDIGDAGYAGGTIDSVAATTDNPSGVPDAAVGGSGATRTLTFTPDPTFAGAVTVTATVSGTENGYSSSMSDTFQLTVVPGPDLTISKTHAGDFQQGDTGRAYTLTVSNVGAGSTLLPGDPLLPSATPVTVTDTLPAGLTPVSADGPGWMCSVMAQDVNCVFGTSLAAGTGAPPVTVWVDVAGNAPPLVTNAATVSGGGDMATANNTAVDLTNIIQLASPTTTTAGSASGQYSDHVLLTATVAPAAPGTVQFTVDTLGVVGSAPVDAAGVAALDFAIPLPAGTYTVQADFHSADPLYLNSSGSGQLTVTREDAVVTAAAGNPFAVPVAAPGGTSQPFTLSAAITELADGSAGDTSNATPVTFTLHPLASGTTYTCTATVSGGGTGGALTASCPFSGVGVNVYDVDITVGGQYYTGAGSSVVTVYDPSLGAVTGGGSVMHGGVRSTFGFTVKYKKDGSLEGNLLYVEHRSGGTVELKSTAMQTLAATGNTGLFQGQATLNGQGAYTFLVRAVDNGEPGSSDQLGLRVLDANGNLVADLTFDPITLSGGNIKVPQPK